MSEPRRRNLVVSSVAALFAALPLPAAAQAWLPPKGEASISEAAQYLNARYHLFWEGQRADRGRMEWGHVTSDVSYSVTDRVAVRAGLPYVVSRYTGAFPHAPVGRDTWDNGNWNGTLQDVSLEVRYQAATRRLAVAPFLAVGSPTVEYEQHSHVAAGRHLREVSAGVYLGRRLDPFLPDGYAHVGLSYTMPERVLGIWHNRNNVDIELGHFVGSAFTVRALGSWQWSHGGLRIPLDSPAGSPYFLVHDQLAKDTHFVAGVGVSYAATGSIDLTATGLRMIRGENTNLVRGVNVAATWSFSPAKLIGRGKAPAPRVRAAGR